LEKLAECNTGVCVVRCAFRFADIPFAQELLQAGETRLESRERAGNVLQASETRLESRGGVASMLQAGETRLESRE